MSKIKSNTAAAKSTEAVEVAPKAKVVQNPANATARTTYEPVVHSTGTIAGKPARLAWYGTKYGCIEIEQADGSFVVHHDTAFGGMRSVDALEGLFDSVAPVVVADPAVIEIVEAPIPVVEFVAPAPFGIVADESKGAGGMSSVPLAAIVPPVGPTAAIAASDLVVGTAIKIELAGVIPAPVVAAEPVYTTLDEVRAAHEAETRGACRASVLRALRVRAGEIALGVPAGGKEKVKPESTGGGTITRTARMSLVEMLAKGIVKVGDEVRLKSKPDVSTTIANGGLTADGRTFNQWASESLNATALNVYVNAVHVPTGKLLNDLRG